MRHLSVLPILMIIVITSGTSFADSLDGRFGIYGKAGALVPLQNDFIGGTSESRTGFATGAGAIFGFCRNFAAEIDLTHVPGLNAEISGVKAYEAKLTDLALGIQYRVASDNRLVPFFGAGVDFITGRLESVSGANRLEWTQGCHVNAGIDYFVTRGIAFTADLRGVVAFEGDVEHAGVKVGKYDPTSFIGTLGIRLMLPENAFWE